MNTSSLTTEELSLLLLFRRKKNEISCIDRPRTFLRQLKDNDLISEPTYLRVDNITSKDQTRNALYEMLEELEKVKPECVKLFWQCVFENHMVKEYPIFKQLKEEHGGALIKPSKTTGSTSKQNDPVEKNTGSGLKRTSNSSQEREEDDRAGPSQPDSSVKNKTKKLKHTAPRPALRKGGKEWKWKRKHKIPVTCGNKKGFLHKGKLARGEKRFIEMGDRWYSGPEFERLGGKEQCKNWKTSIRCGDFILYHLIQIKLLKYPGPKWKSTGKMKMSTAMRNVQYHSQAKRKEGYEEDVVTSSGHDSKAKDTSMKEENTMSVSCGPMTGILQESCLKSWSPFDDQKNDDHCFTCGQGQDLLCCDGCPKAFHNRCHLPALSDAPRDWLCTFCSWRNSQHMTDTQVMESLISKYELQCQYLLQFLFIADQQGVFSTETCQTASSYSSVIPHPMWLERVREKLQSDYHLVGEFISDIRLIFSNCALYNKDSKLREQSMNLSEKFEKKIHFVFNILRRSCKSCVDVPDTNSWILVEPEVSTVKGVSTYHLRSPAGRYEDIDSGLRWSSNGPVTLSYLFGKVMDRQVLDDELASMQYKLAGPLMNIKLVSGELEEIHLPHFLCLGGDQISVTDGVKVFHKQDSGVSLELCELSRFHARLVKPSFSLLGVVYSLAISFFRSWKEKREKIQTHADVMVYQCSISHHIFRLYLFPLDADLKELIREQEKESGGLRILKNRPERKLQLDELYKLKTECSTDDIEPEQIKLRNDRVVPNHFDLTRENRNQACDFTIELLCCERQQRVWKARMSTPCSLPSVHPSSNIPFLTVHQADLIKRVTVPKQIADKMLSQDLISEESYACIQSAITDQEKMRQVFNTLRSFSPENKLAFIKILDEEVPDLMEELRAQGRHN